MERPGSMRAASRLALIAACIAAAAAAAGLAGGLRELGHNIPQPNIETDYLVGLLWATVLGFTILVWPVQSVDRKILIRLWVAKCIVTLIVMLFYEWNYLLDSYPYFGFATLWRNENSTLQFQFGAGSDAVILVATAIGKIVPSFHALKVSFSMIGLAAVFVFYRAAVIFLGREDRRILYILGLFPTILFWSSILGKDPLQLLGIAVYAYGVVAYTRGRGSRNIALIGLGALMAAAIRIWSAPILLLPLIFIAWRPGAGRMTRVISGLLVVALVIAAATKFADQYKIESVDDLRLTAENVSRSWAGGGSSLHNDVVFTSVGSMVAYAPLGLVTVLFRPLPGEILNPFGLLAGLENLLLIFLTLRAIARWRSAPWSDPVVRWALALVLIWGLVYAFLAYNLGSVVRFKLQIYPVMLLLLLYISSTGSRQKST